ncbi:hypothetical protein [Miltoncostaea oceani]|jgi:hypothetical protein|uniref:hypothetical protein n=1 Tax=Miltoncostaea oceani TaxID=2843216 RepID=UPI001C3DDB6E|nr:hypothetical protein [Miltoncostaea oceani]
MRSVLAEEPGLAAELVEPAPGALLAPLVTPPLTERQAAGLDLILEGFLLHHGTPRHLRPSGAGREVLAGDWCYANGLVRIAEAGDLFVVEALADLIALGAGIVAAGDRDGLVPLWRATTAVIAARSGPGRDADAERFLRAQDALRRTGDASALAGIADALPPTPGLEEAFAR